MVRVIIDAYDYMTRRNMWGMGKIGRPISAAHKMISQAGDETPSQTENLDGFYLNQQMPYTKENNNNE